MLKYLVILAALSVPAMAQLSNERESGFATPAQITAKSFTFTHKESYVATSYTHVWEFNFDVAPSYTYTITPCMRGGTCFTPTTATTAANANIVMTNTVADFYTVTVTWTGGTVGRFTLNITGTQK